MLDCERALVGSAHFQQERNGALLRVHAVVCVEVLDTADIVSETMFHQFTVPSSLTVDSVHFSQNRRQRRQTGKTASSDPQTSSVALALSSELQSRSESPAHEGNDGVKGGNRDP